MENNVINDCDLKKSLCGFKSEGATGAWMLVPVCVISGPRTLYDFNKVVMVSDFPTCLLEKP